MKTRLEVLRNNAYGISSKKHKGWLLDAVERAEKAEAKLDKFAKLRDRYHHTALKYPAATTPPLKVSVSIDSVLDGE